METNNANTNTIEKHEAELQDLIDKGDQVSFDDALESFVITMAKFNHEATTEGALTENEYVGAIYRPIRADLRDDRTINGTMNAYYGKPDLSDGTQRTQFTITALDADGGKHRVDVSVHSSDSRKAKFHCYVNYDGESIRSGHALAEPLQKLLLKVAKSYPADLVAHNALIQGGVEQDIENARHATRVQSRIEEL